MANYCPPSQFVPHFVPPHVPKSLPRALRNTRHLHEWNTSSEGGAISHSEIKCCEKDFKKLTYRINHY